ncbi:MULTISPECIES: CpaF family protein [Halobacteriovorax]|uniref:CpaF family protein n=1 Tax=Halobacteriovorax vibrionivorans TaxID=2152716 RepID=A0ABY0IDQ0_9BACT|nr:MULTISPECIES: CpaF family protein [Halobacteriovorax]AYF44657.1 type II/IV secretion system protein [Halobacteriovorax sp. BALOs_7]RZF20742.1 CpaF family protein [Halobacteriovorax vibrionivorans]TGD48131.1 CpaF family protein [Halobacteriovorax sp. Y22]
MSSVFTDAIKNLLSPIGDLLEDEGVSEVMINGPHEIFVEKKGLVFKVPNEFEDEGTLISAMRAIAQSVNRTIDEDNPRLDARLPDGSRIHVVLPPMAKNGTTVAIRKFSKDSLTLKDLIEFGSMSDVAARFLDICVYLGKNILVSGGTGSGKTTMLNVLGGRIPKTQRLIIIEDAAELQVDAEHVVNFETRKADELKGLGEITIRDLVISAMRLRPDRIIVGEVRGDEALDLVQVMNTGHDGSMGTVHANNPVDACTRLETLCLMGETKIPPDAIRKMVGSALQIIVQCSRYHDGGRRTSHISEVLGVDNNGNYITRDIFRWVQTGKDPETGKYIGEMVPCNYVPTFFEDIVVHKLPFPKQNFLAPDWARPLVKKKAA